MLNSLYLSLWACNFISLVNSEFNASPLIHIIMLGPVLVLLPLLGEIVKVSSLLAAIADLDLDIIGSVLELTEEKATLLKEVREKILARVDGQTEKDQMRILTQLYDEIDIDGNGMITKWEFRDMLRALSLHYSDHKFKKLFKSIDTNRSGDIDMNELIALVFPNLAEDMEVKRRAELLRERSDSMENSETAQYRPRFLSSIKRLSSEVERSKRELSYRSVSVEEGNDNVDEESAKLNEKACLSQSFRDDPVSGGSCGNSVDGVAYTPLFEDKVSVDNMRMSLLMASSKGCEDEDSDASDSPVKNISMSMLMKGGDAGDVDSDDDMSVITIDKRDAKTSSPAGEHSSSSQVFPDTSGVVHPVCMSTLMMDPVLGSSGDEEEDD
mmetsp:Transcript_36784/g.68420  ORF Transcript_36784/g.68420 Transcript_36784/m.68420 type:complete len:383 (+) Transcript_36784:2-1150(+)